MLKQTPKKRAEKRNRDRIQSTKLEAKGSETFDPRDGETRNGLTDSAEKQTGIGNRRGPAERAGDRIARSADRCTDRSGKPKERESARSVESTPHLQRSSGE